MLTKLEPTQALEIFDRIWLAIAASIYCKPEDTHMRERVRSSIETGKLHVWVNVEGDVFAGIVLTTFVYQAVEQTMTLLIYAAYVTEADLAHARKNYKILNEYAVAGGCSNVAFYTNNQKLVQFAQRIGGHIEQYISIPVIKEADNGIS